MRWNRSLTAVWLSLGVIAGCAVPPTPAIGAGDDPGTARWTIGPGLVECVGVGPMWCLQYRDTPGGAWKSFHGRIEGFEFRPGHETDLVVRSVPVPNPPADAPNRRVVMVREIERRPLTVTSLPQALQGAWQLVAMPGVASVSGPRGPITMSFEAPGRLAGQSAVNRYSSHVDAAAGWMRVSSAVSTRMAGPPEAMMLESEFLARLQRAGVWRVDGDVLRLRDAGGAELMSLRRAAPGSAS